MVKVLVWICAAATSVSVAAVANQSPRNVDPGTRVVAYVQGGQIPAVIHPEKLTHINFSFARIDAGRAVLDQPGVAADLAKLRALRQQNPQLKVMVSVGGWLADGFSGVTPRNNGVNQPYERYEGDHSYAELSETLIGKQGFVRYWDARADAPYLWNSASRTLISYDDPQSIAIKACYVREHRLGGMMFWDLGSDRNDELLSVIARGCPR